MFWLACIPIPGQGSVPTHRRLNWERKECVHETKYHGCWSSLSVSRRDATDADTTVSSAVAPSDTASDFTPVTVTNAFASHSLMLVKTYPFRSENLHVGQ